MAYWNNNSTNTRKLDSFGLSTSHTGGNDSTSEFYELEVGVVLDIVLDDKHPVFKTKTNLTTINPKECPPDIKGKIADPTDFNYTWIGRALIRPIVSERLTSKDNLLWAYPLESNVSEYPLINEIVVLYILDNKLYYSRKLNFRNLPNHNLDFNMEGATSGRNNTVLFSNQVLTGSIESITDFKGSGGNHGYAGQYFVANNKIRTLKRYEGDLLIESRFGQSVHMTAYDANRKNDVGAYPDYENGGNPMILIRNRQRSLKAVGDKLILHDSPNIAMIEGTPQEKNVGGFIEENINHDGSSIHITSGQTISGFVTTCYKKMFGSGEEVAKFKGNTSFVYPILNKDQIVINSDRLIFSSRYGETFHYSKKRYGIVTDSEYTVDAHDQIVMTTHVKTVFNSPAIYLGEYDQTNEPALLGQTTVNWLYELCNWLLAHIHIYQHAHVHAGKESPSTTQTVVQEQIRSLTVLRDKLQSLLSRRVFITGGGFAPGQNGANITNGKEPTKIDVNNGKGVPGGWKGSNYRIS